MPKRTFLPTVEFQEKKKDDSGNGSPRRWGWGIPLKKRSATRIGDYF